MATNAPDVSKDEERDKAVVSWRNRNEAVKKGEILREIQKLKVQIQAMEREKCTHIYSQRNDFRHDFSLIQEMETKQTSERKSEQIKVKQQLEKIGHMVKRFHKELRDVKPTPEFVEKLKMIMEDIEGTINAFKEQQRKHYETMLLEERTAWTEIQAMEKKFDSWSQIPSDTSLTRRTTTPARPLTSARDITKDLPPEVATFEKFVEQNGGVRGTWDEYDHQTFLKFRQRYQGRAVFLQHLLPALPTRTEEEIQAHEEWYQEYLFLNETKKDAIKKWREKKEEEKEELLAKACEVPEETVDEGKARLQEKIEAEKMQRKAGLNAYKVQKELERAHKEERKLREQLEEHKKHQEWKKKQREMSAKVLEHKRQREEEEAFIKQQKAEWEDEERDRQKQVSAREIVKFRRRDESVLHDKIAKEKEKVLAAQEKERRLQMLKRQVEIEVERDPSRLLKPTAGMKNRMRDNSRSGGQVLTNMMPHRAVPAWRQGP